jgi:L-2-hydroxyglutarate oxidase LhgO
MFYDFIILGSGIVGLSIARSLIIKEPSAKVLVIEKEAALGMHASGRNSGVLHSGIYYPKHTLKSKVCFDGARLMKNYCETHNLPHKKIGKVIVPKNEKEDLMLETLIDRSIPGTELIDRKQLLELEPDVISSSGRALYLPESTIVDSVKILQKIANEIKDSGVDIIYNTKILNIDPDSSIISINNKNYQYAFIINATGQHADHMAKSFNVGAQYTMIPFKGIYYRLKPDSNIHSNGLVYPVPDPRRPFLGIHTVKDMHNNVYFGPTAIPAFGRENYHGIDGVEVLASVKMMYYLTQQYISNKQGFRNYAHNESLHYLKYNFLNESQKLFPKLKSSDLLASKKRGIRPQLYDKYAKELVMDLVVKSKGNSLHILNAISPAFTASLAFSDLVVDRILKNDSFFSHEENAVIL